MLSFILNSAPTVSLTASEMTTTATTWLSWILTSIISVFNTMVQSPIIMAFLVFALVGVVVAFARKLLM